MQQAMVRFHSPQKEKIKALVEKYEKILKKIDVLIYFC